LIGLEDLVDLSYTSQGTTRHSESGFDPTLVSL